MRGIKTKVYAFLSLGHWRVTNLFVYSYMQSTQPIQITSNAIKDDEIIVLTVLMGMWKEVF